MHELKKGNYKWNTNYLDVNGVIQITDWRFGNYDKEWALKVSVKGRPGT